MNIFKFSNPQLYTGVNNDTLKISKVPITFNDLSYRVLQEGFKNRYISSTTIIHYKGESTVRDGTYFKRFSKSMQFFYKKHFKKSLFFDVFMKLGSVIFTVLKMKQQKKTIRKIEAYIVFSKEEWFIH